LLEGLAIILAKENFLHFLILNG